MPPPPSEYNLLTFIIIVGAAAGVLICWAVYHFMGPDEGPRFKPMSNQQAVYMREVRLRNLKFIAWMMNRRDILRELEDSLRDDGEE